MILQDVAVAPVPLVESMKSVGDYFDSGSGIWRLSLFQHLLPPPVLAEIMAMPQPAPNIGPDRVIWGLTNDGIFSSKYAYDARPRLDGGSSGVPWHRVWKWDGPFKISNFLWRALSNGIWVNFRRQQAGMTNDPLCPLCRDEEETIIHLLRDSRYVKPL